MVKNDVEVALHEPLFVVKEGRIGAIYVKLRAVVGDGGGGTAEGKPNER